MHERVDFGGQHLRDEIRIGYSAAFLTDVAWRINFRYFLVKTGNKSILNIGVYSKINDLPGDGRITTMTGGIRDL